MIIDLQRRAKVYDGHLDLLTLTPGAPEQVILTVKTCDGNPAEAVFEIEELRKVLHEISFQK